MKQKHFQEQEYVLLYATHLASHVSQPNEDMFQVSMVAEYYHVRYTLESGFALEVSFGQAFRTILSPSTGTLSHDQQGLENLSQEQTRTPKII